jgi:hypothetical protein
MRKSGYTPEEWEKIGTDRRYTAQDARREWETAIAHRTRLVWVSLFPAGVATYFGLFFPYADETVDVFAICLTILGTLGFLFCLGLFCEVNARLGVATYKNSLRYKQDNATRKLEEWVMADALQVEEFKPTVKDLPREDDLPGSGLGLDRRLGVAEQVHGLRDC